VTALNSDDQSAEGLTMHGAWAFDLLLMIVTTGVTVLAFRQLAIEHEENTESSE
jgi:hypothetical protein